MENSLKNKVIIVTGGGGLLGEAIIKRLTSYGAFCINFDINKRTTLNLSDVYCDITDNKSVDDALTLVLNKFPIIHGLVNNAYPRTEDWGRKFEDIEFDSWKKNIDWQLNSYFYITQKVIIEMAKHKNGSIVNMASIYGISGPDFSVYENTNMTMPAAYSAIKGALLTFTKYLASYYGPVGVRVNAVSPGGIFNNQNNIFVENYCRKVPLGRMGLPDDIAPSVAFLLSEYSSYVTGHNFIVDGGWTCK
jgi:NAD(P)-dependent dehydrogenase (short-subunit alcohol dehydrogenase family)